MIDSDIDHEWERIPHFYMQFYVYQYATGFSAAMAIARRILAGDPETKEGYFRFLKGGCSRPPVELLKLVGWMRWKNWRKKEFFVRDFWFVPTQYGLKGIKM